MSQTAFTKEIKSIVVQLEKVIRHKDLVTALAPGIGSSPFLIILRPRTRLRSSNNVWKQSNKLWGSFSYCQISTSCLSIIENETVILKVHR